MLGSLTSTLWPALNKPNRVSQAPAVHHATPIRDVGPVLSTQATTGEPSRAKARRGALHDQLVVRSVNGSAQLLIRAQLAGT